MKRASTEKADFLASESKHLKGVRANVIDLANSYSPDKQSARQSSDSQTQDDSKSGEDADQHEEYIEEQVQCPLCMAFYSLNIITEHAAYCGGPPTEVTSSLADPALGKATAWHCPTCTLIADPNDQFCRACGASVPRQNSSVGLREDKQHGVATKPIENDHGRSALNIAFKSKNRDSNNNADFLPKPCTMGVGQLHQMNGGANEASCSTVIDAKSTLGIHRSKLEEMSNRGAIEGILEALSSYYRKRLPEPGQFLQYHLCRPVTFFTQRGGYAMGTGWACGYRNIQMLCSALMASPVYREVLFNKDGVMPTIYEIQTWIERAWSQGFDVEGSLQLGGKLHGTKKWIGATECAALLRYFGIDAQVIDISQKDSSGLHDKMFEWIWEYFSQRENGTQYPLYFQHHGHSRTIIGVEKHSKRVAKTTERFLLVLDPSAYGENIIPSIKEGQASWHKFLKRRVGVLKKEQYQLVAVHGDAIMSMKEQAKSKIIQGVRIT